MQFGLMSPSLTPNLSPNPLPNLTLHLSPSLFSCFFLCVSVVQNMITSRLGHTLRLGFRSLAAHRLRSGLTALGIVLGVASVIVMLGVGEAARYHALKQLEDLGANTVILRSVKPND